MNNIIRLYLYTTTKGLISILRDKYIRISLPWKTNDYTEGVAQGETSRSEKVKIRSGGVSARNSSVRCSSSELSANAPPG